MHCHINEGDNSIYTIYKEIHYQPNTFGAMETQIFNTEMLFNGIE